MSNNFDPDKAQQIVGPDLGLNCFKSYQQATKVTISSEGSF